MPISIDEFRFPRFIKYQEKKPFSEDIQAKFMDGTHFNNQRRFHADEFPQAGYNPLANATTIKPVELDNDELTLQPS